MSYYTDFQSILNTAIKTNAANLSLLSQANAAIITSTNTTSINSSGVYSDYNVVITLNGFIETLRAMKYNINNTVSDTLIDSTIAQLKNILPVPTTINEINYALTEFYKNNEKTLGTFTLAQNYLRTKFGAALDKTTGDNMIRSFIKK